MRQHQAVRWGFGAMAAISMMAAAAPAIAGNGRVVYIPPVFSNKDWSCPQGMTFTGLPVCWDFSITNLSPIAQSVTLKTRAGTKLNIGPSMGVNYTLGADSTAALSFNGTLGQSLQAAFCLVCNSSGCGAGWNVGNLAGSGAVGPPGAGGTTSGSGSLNGTNVEWMYYHAEGIFEVDVAEDRGALVGRLNQRLFPGPATYMYVCNDHWTSPQVVVELNGGRAF